MPQPRIGLFDIETAPIKAYIWGPIHEPSVMAVEQDTYLLSFSFKWLGQRAVKTYCLPDYRNFARDKTDDSALVRDLWALMDEADIIVAHNGDAFDIKKSNARFLVHGLKPPSTYKTFDTLKAARKHFKFDTNKLDDLGRYLNVGRKIPNTGKDLWLGCMRGDPKSWRIMRRYNPQDVRLLERVYLKVRPWTSHPNLNLYTGRHNCPTCQSHNVKRKGFQYLRSVVRQRYLCLGCGAQWCGEIVKPEVIRCGELTSRRLEAATLSASRDLRITAASRKQKPALTTRSATTRSTGRVRKRQNR